MGLLYAEVRVVYVRGTGGRDGGGAGRRGGFGERGGAGARGRPEDEPGSGAMVAFVRQLKLLRLRAGLDRTEFGNRVGCAAQSVVSFEQGRRIAQPGFIDQADPVLAPEGCCWR